MNITDLRHRLLSTFAALHDNRRIISIAELLDALRIVDLGEKVSSMKALRENIELLWNGGKDPRESKAEFQMIWDANFAGFSFDEPDQSLESNPATFKVELGPAPIQPFEPEVAPETANLSPVVFPIPPQPEQDSTAIDENPTVAEENDSAPTPQPRPFDPMSSESPHGYSQRRNPFRRREPILRIKSDIPGPTPSINVMPVTTPSNIRSSSGVNEVFAYTPISRLSMAYAWRYLRRPVADGPANILDVDATLKLVANQGFFLAPIYRRRLSNHAHLVLLLDQGGSMGPFQSITRDVVETAQQESSLQEVKVYFFHNFVTDVVYNNDRLTSGKELEQALDECTLDTSILIVSDAGAARGSWNSDRIDGTQQMISNLKHKTPLIAWLNPMPRGRWGGCSAENISRFSQMFQMNPDGFSSAIDALQGRGITF